MPQGYFDAEAVRALADFRKMVEADPREDLLAKFPEAAVARVAAGHLASVGRGRISQLVAVLSIEERLTRLRFRRWLQLRADDSVKT